jgi:hypothetical protein
MKGRTWRRLGGSTDIQIIHLILHACKQRDLDEEGNEMEGTRQSRRNAREEHYEDVL